MHASDLETYASEFRNYTELRRQTNTIAVIQLLNGSVVANTKSSDSGISARVCDQGVWGFSSRPETDDAAIRATITEATENAALLAQHGARPGKLPQTKGQAQADFSTTKPRRSQAELIAYLQAVDAHIASSYPDLRGRQIVMQALDMEKHLYNSEGSRSDSTVTRSVVMVALIGENADGAPVSLSRPIGGLGQFEDRFSDPAELNEEIAALHTHLMAKCAGVAPQAGVHDVVLDSDLAGILAHEAVGHTAEGDIVKAGSVAGDLMGQSVASELITLVDYANSRQGETLASPLYVDDEGTPAQDQILIEDGVLKGYMHNKQTAAFFNAAPTGNARAYQFSDEPLVRMRNTTIEPGNSRLQDMIASIEDGYYLMWPGNGQADTTGEFMFLVTLGYEIKNGKLGRAITDTTISGVAFDMLKSVTMVSDDLSWNAYGMCGKKQPIPVAMGGPAIKCKVHLGGA